MSTGVEPPPTAAAFSRTASGLIRAASARDAFGFNVFNVNVGMGTLYVLLLLPSLYPRANVYLSIIFGAILVAPVIITYARLSAVYPRSGGDYVYVSRLVHPAIGFAENLSLAVFLLFFVGVGGVLTAQYGLAPIFTVAAAYSGNDSLLSVANWLVTQNGVFIVATVIITLFTLVFVFTGMRVYFRIQTVSFVIGTVALVALLVYGLFASRGTALANIDAALKNIGGGGVAKLAVGSQSGFSWSETLKASVWPWLYFQGAALSAYIGSEVKRPARAQLIGMMGALAWVVIWMFVLSAAMFKLFGWAFFSNIGLADPAKMGLSMTPSYSELVGLSLGNGILAVILMVLFVVWGYTWMGPEIASVSRMMFAWGMDGLMPKWVTNINKRLQTPVNSLIVVFVVAVAFAAIFTYGNVTMLVGNINFAVSYVLVGLSALLLPYVNRTLWRSSPGHGRLLGMPTTSVLGALIFPTMAIIIYYQLTDPYSGTSISESAGILAFALAILVVGLPIYYIVRWAQRARGKDIDYAFREIPPE